MRPLHFLWQVVRRLRKWAYEPTSEEKLRTMFGLGKTAERTKSQELPIAQAQQQHTGPLAPELPEKLCWPNMAWSRHFFSEVRPDLYKPPERPRFTAPIRRVQLLPDDTWLVREQHTGPFDLEALERQTEPTLHVSAVRMRSLHPRR